MANIFQELLGWSSGLAPWQNEAIRRLFLRKELSTDDRNQIFEHAMVDLGLRPRPEPFVDLMLKPTDLPSPPSPGRRLHLSAIHGLENVNALEGGQRLEIGDQLTVIYGGNASGKSGYVRVLKKACRARAVEEILPNVYERQASEKPAVALFEIEEDGMVRQERWCDGVEPPESLGRFAVFDSQCARVYITEDNELGFLPYGFDIIHGLAVLTAEVKAELQQLGAGSSPDPTHLRPFLDNTSVGKCLASMTASTTEEDIKSKAGWSPYDERLLASKKMELQNLSITGPQAHRRALTVQRDLVERLRSAVESMASAISEAKVNDIAAKASELRKYDEAVAAAARLEFGDLELKGVGTEVWRALMDAAAAYSTEQAYPERPFPAIGKDARCVLCHQPLDDAATARMRRFWTFIMDDTSTKRDAAKAALHVETGTLAGLPRGLPDDVMNIEGQLDDRRSHLFLKVKDYFTLATVRVAGIQAGCDSLEWKSLGIEPLPPIELLAKARAEIDSELTLIVDDAQITQQLASLPSEIAEREASKRLNENLDLVLDHLFSLKQSSAALRAAESIATNSISIKAREMQEKFVTKAFKERVQQELEPFGLVRVKAGIDRRSQRGKVLHKVTVAGAAHADPAAVFSEGERTALSLACFLAELAASEDNCGVVLDDPLSSLDHEVRTTVVNRLVREARDRQVLIFTHDMMSYCELCASAQRQQVEVKLQNVEALGIAVGLVSGAPPWDARNVTERRKQLDEQLKDLVAAEERKDVASYRSQFGRFYSLLRSTWERAVEEVLFNKVVQRLDRRVKTLSLDGVWVDDVAVEAVFDGMTQSSRMIDAHDHAVAENSSLPGSTRVRNDLSAFGRFIFKQKEKAKEARKRREHLKS